MYRLLFASLWLPSVALAEEPTWRLELEVPNIGWADARIGDGVPGLGIGGGVRFVHRDGPGVQLRATRAMFEDEGDDLMLIDLAYAHRTAIAGDLRLGVDLGPYLGIAGAFREDGSVSGGVAIGATIAVHLYGFETGIDVGYRLLFGAQDPEHALTFSVRLGVAAWG